MKIVWLMATLLVLFSALRLVPGEGSFAVAVVAWVGVLLSGLVLNFSPATQGSKWKSAGWGLFYGALLFVVIIGGFIFWLASTGIQC